jgi:glycosyltransferase involved in cell wall biosynthesis
VTLLIRPRLKGRAPNDGALTGVLVTQPVHQHAYEAALAAQEAGLLKTFATGLYFASDGHLGRMLRSRRVPPRFAARIEREIRRRSHDDLDPALVTSIRRHQLVEIAFRRFARWPIIGRWQSQVWAHVSFDAAVAGSLDDLGPRIVHAFEGAALATFRRAKEIGATTILDASSAHERIRDVVPQEVGSIKWLERLRAERLLADYILVASEFVASCLLENGVPPEKLLTLGYGVDTDRFGATVSQRSALFRVLYVGRISVLKGIPQLLEAWRLLRLKDAELLLVGTADRHGRRLLDARSPSIRWVPGVPKHAVDRWFQQADLFVMPSLADAWGLAVGEAMASRLPVVTTTSTGFPMRHGVDGFRVEAGDVNDLAQKILYFYEHPGVGRQMGEAGRELVAGSYTWRQYRRRLAAIYESVLQGEVPMAEAFTA